jgi:intein/homing endonuclease/replicative DNA helicase
LERLLRSVIQIGGNPDADDAYQNWLRFREHNLEYAVEEDRRIVDYLSDFYSQMNAPPDVAIIREFFEKRDDVEAVSRLGEIAKAQWYARQNYLAIVRSEQESQLTRNFVLLCRDVTGIAEHGRNLDKPVDGKRIIRGVHDAVNYLYSKLSDYTRVETGEKLEGVVSDDAEEVLDEYESACKADSYADRNLFGLEPVDVVCQGHRSGELWVHCAFSAELKTTLALNYAYNNAFVYGRNIFYGILEMPYRQLRRQIYVLHSSNGKFVTEWMNADVKAGRPPYTGLDYRKVRDGKLDELGRKRLKIVAQDFQATCRGRLYVWRPEAAGVTINDIQRRAEMFDNKYGCQGVIVDYLGPLITPKRRSSDTVTNLNNIVTECRWMALSFARGRNVPVLALFQMNRQGKARADKNDGRYDFAAISYANQCLAEGTLVKTNRGLVPVECVCPGRDQVWSTSGWKQVIDKFDNGLRATVRVTTSFGDVNEVTPDHRFRTVDGYGHKVWVSAADLQPGDSLLTDVGKPLLPRPPPVMPELVFGRGEKPKDLVGRLLKVPRTMTDELAYLMGAWVGDGSFKPQINTIGYSGNAAEVVLRDRLVRTFRAVFGQPCTLFTSMPSHLSTFEIRKCSKALTRWFIAVGMNRRPGVPPSILVSPRSAVVAFLQGLFDTDGSVNTQGVIAVGLKEAHEETLRQVKLLLAELGIQSTLRFGRQRLNGKQFGRWTLVIQTRRSRRLFASDIGFTEPAKQAKLDDCMLRLSTSRKSGDNTKWPIGGLISVLYSRYWAARRIRKVAHAVRRWTACAASVSAGSIEALLSALRDVVGDPELDRLRSLFASSAPVLVESVVAGTTQRVWDLEVDGDHEYATAGLLSHNCEKDADVITYTYLNDQLRKDGKFYMGNIKNRDNPIFDRMTGKILWHSKRMRHIYDGLLDMSTDGILANTNNPRYTMPGENHPRNLNALDMLP